MTTSDHSLLHRPRPVSGGLQTEMLCCVDVVHAGSHTYCTVQGSLCAQPVNCGHESETEKKKKKNTGELTGQTLAASSREIPNIPPLPCPRREPFPEAHHSSAPLYTHRKYPEIPLLQCAFTLSQRALLQPTNLIIGAEVANPNNEVDQYSPRGAECVCECV